MGKAFIASETLSHIPAIYNIEIHRSFISGDTAIQDPDSDEDSLPPLLSQSDEDTEDKDMQTHFDEELPQTNYTTPYCVQTVSYEADKNFHWTMTPPTYRQNTFQLGTQDSPNNS